MCIQVSKLQQALATKQEAVQNAEQAQQSAQQEHQHLQQQLQRLQQSEQQLQEQLKEALQGGASSEAALGELTNKVRSSVLVWQLTSLVY